MEQVQVKPTASEENISKVRESQEDGQAHAHERRFMSRREAVGPQTVSDIAGEPVEAWQTSRR